MTSAELLEHLKTEAMKLPEKERFELALDLEESIATESEDVVGELSPAWRDEIRRRVEDVRSGRSKGRPAKEVMDDIRTRILHR